MIYHRSIAASESSYVSGYKYCTTNEYNMIENSDVMADKNEGDRSGLIKDY